MNRSSNSKSFALALWAACLPLPCAAKPTETILHSFNGDKDGGYPAYGLTVARGKLYGTTSKGGANNRGTFFSVTREGRLDVLYSFAADGSETPTGPLLYASGALYGTSSSEVFVLSLDGQRSTLYTFTGQGEDAELPNGELVESNGTFYGVSQLGGTMDSGTIFSITTSGQEKVLHSFDFDDGELPLTGLTVLNDTLYGVASDGGAFSPGVECAGTAFSMTLSGTFTLLHSFGATGDGHCPEGTLLPVNGTLYGTTREGGSSGNHNFGWGIMYSLTPAGNEAPIGIFGVGGHEATGNLLLKGKFLCGTAQSGGGGKFGGDGTVFKLPVPAGGKVKADYAFGNAKNDGVIPSPGLIRIKNDLYGTTNRGGSNGIGAIFKITQ